MSGETRLIPVETWQFSFTSRLPLRGRLRSLPLHVLFVRRRAELLLQIVLVFLDQRRVPRPAVDLGRLVLALVELLLGPVIVSVRDLRLVDNPLHQVRRDERNALLVAEDHVTRHHRGVADADRNVDPRHHDVVDGGWRSAPVVSSQIGQRRFGYGARSHYGKTHPSWNPALESELRRDWTASGGQENDWATESQFIRKGWDYKDRKSTRLNSSHL